MFEFKKRFGSCNGQFNKIFPSLPEEPKNLVYAPFLSYYGFRNTALFWLNPISVVQENMS